jgi:hypothetical protein
MHQKNIFHKIYLSKVKLVKKGYLNCMIFKYVIINFVTYKILIIKKFTIYGT